MIYCFIVTTYVLVISKTKEEHYLAISEVFNRLRNHGLRIKPSKTTLFCTEKIKIYGVVVDLKTGKISPEENKIEALRNRAIPRTKKELKSFLGALLFFFRKLVLLLGRKLQYCIEQHVGRNSV